MTTIAATSPFPTLADTAAAPTGNGGDAFAPVLASLLASVRGPAMVSPADPGRAMPRANGQAADGIPLPPGTDAPILPAPVSPFIGLATVAPATTSPPAPVPMPRNAVTSAVGEPKPDDDAFTGRMAVSDGGTGTAPAGAPPLPGNALTTTAPASATAAISASTRIRTTSPDDVREGETVFTPPADGAIDGHAAPLAPQVRAVATAALDQTVPRAPRAATRSPASTVDPARTLPTGPVAVAVNAAKTVLQRPVPAAAADLDAHPIDDDDAAAAVLDAPSATVAAAIAAPPAVDAAVAAGGPVAASPPDGVAAPASRLLAEGGRASTSRHPLVAPDGATKRPADTTRDVADDDGPAAAAPQPAPAERLGIDGVPPPSPPPAGARDPAKPTTRRTNDQAAVVAVTSAASPAPAAPTADPAVPPSADAPTAPPPFVTAVPPPAPPAMGAVAMRAVPADRLVSNAASADDATRRPDTPSPMRVAPSVVTAAPSAPAILPALQAFGAALHRAAAAERRPARDPQMPGVAPLAPMTATIAAAETPPVDTTQPRWPEAMVARIEQIRDAQNAGDTRIRLHPDALGAVDVTLRQDAAGMHVQLHAAEPATRALLADAQPQLQSLADQRGLRLAGADVGGGGATQTGQGWAGDRRQPAPATPARRAAPSTDPRADDPADTRLA